MTLTATHYAYYHLCHRKLWLFHHGIQMEHTSDLVAEGNLVDERSYAQRADRWQQIELEGIKIDYYDPKRQIIREVKKSSKREKAHIAQVKYYLYRFKEEGIAVKYGLLEYPKMRKTEEVFLEEEDTPLIQTNISKMKAIVSSDSCPDRVKKSLCKHCAYLDFCFIEEADME